MSETRYYPNCGPYLSALSRHLGERFDQEGYDVQVVEEPEATTPTVTFQMRKRYSERWIKTISTYTGLDTAATLLLRAVGEDLEVQFGGAKWIDKAAVAGVGVLASLGVLLVPAGIGAWKQRQLLEDLQQAVDDFFRRRDG